MLIEVQTQEVINGVVYPVVKQIEIEEQPIEDPRTYKQKVEDYIREKYTVSDELAILRQRDTKPEEYAEYYAYCEECKAKSK